MIRERNAEKSNITHIKIIREALIFGSASVSESISIKIDLVFSVSTFSFASTVFLLKEAKIGLFNCFTCFHLRVNLELEHFKEERFRLDLFWTI
jgi:hypothetical protein